MRAAFLLATFVAVTSALSAAAPARAQEDDTYRDLVHRAVQEHAAGRYQEARALFVRAHERSPNARTLRGIGMTNFELRQYAAAIEALERSLAETRRPLTDSQRESVRDLLERSEAFVARYALEPANARESVRVDGVPGIVTEEGTLLLDMGEHEVGVRCEGCREEPRRVRVSGGEQGTLDFTAAAPAPVERPAEGAQPVEVDGAGPAPLSIALLVVAGATGAGAIGAGLWWRERNGEIGSCDARPDACLNRDRLRSERNASVGITVGLAAAALGLVTAGLLTIQVEDDDGQHTRLSCVPAGMGVACAGAF